MVEYKNLKNLFFEVQVRTILQHDWAEIEHDKNYKFSGKLPDEIARRFMLLAGSLEIADREFNNISKEIDSLSFEVEKGIKSGELNFEINTTSLNQFLSTKFENLLKDRKVLSWSRSEQIIDELEKYGIKSLDELNNLISSEKINDIENFYLNDLEKEVRAIGLIRFILILNDYRKYFENSYDKKWKVWHNRVKNKALFDKYNVDWRFIEKEYGPKL